MLIRPVNESPERQVRGLLNGAAEVVMNSRAALRCQIGRFLLLASQTNCGSLANTAAEDGGDSPSGVGPTDGSGGSRGQPDGEGRVGSSGMLDTGPSDTGISEIAKDGAACGCTVEGGVGETSLECACAALAGSPYACREYAPLLAYLSESCGPRDCCVASWSTHVTSYDTCGLLMVTASATDSVHVAYYYDAQTHQLEGVVLSPFMGFTFGLSPCAGGLLETINAWRTRPSRVSTAECTSSRYVYNACGGDAADETTPDASVVPSGDSD